MVLSIFLDLAPGYFFFANDINMVVFIITMVMIIALEGWLLWKLNWAGVRKSVLASILINIFSAAFGFFILQGIFMFHYFPSSRNLFSFNTHIHMFGNWMITIFMEGVILVLLNLRKWRRGLRSSVIINTASYILFDIVLFGLSLVN